MGARYGASVSAHICTCAELPPCVGRTAVPWHSQALARIKSTFELWASESSYSQGCFLRLEIYFHFAIQMINQLYCKIILYFNKCMGISVTVSASFRQLMKSQLYVFIYLQLPHIILYLKFNSYMFVFFNFLLLCGGSYIPAYVVRQVCGD